MNFTRHAFFHGLLALLFLHGTHCSAATWQQTVAARTTAEYDSNPAMSAANYEGIWRYFFEPNYTLAGRFGEDELRTGIALQLARASNNTLSPDRDSPSIFLDWSGYSTDNEYGISSRYAEISTRDSAIEATGLVPADSTRASRTLSGRWSNTLSERSTLIMNALYENVFYRGGNFINYTTRTGSMVFNHDLSENNKPFVRVSHAEYETADGSTGSSMTNSAAAGWNWRASDNLEGTLQAGKSRIDDAEISTQGSAMVQYTSPRSVLILNAERQVSPSGTGGFVLVDQANGNWNYALSERSNAGIDLAWRKITAIINRTANVWLQYELDTFWAIRTYYRHNILELGESPTIYSNILGFTLSYTHSDF